MALDTFRPGGRARSFELGEVRLAIVSLLSDGPKHGYQHMKELEERSGRRVVPDRVVLERFLALLDGTQATVSVSLDATTSVTLKATNSHGTVTAQATVVVLPLPPNPPEPGLLT